MPVVRHALDVTLRLDANPRRADAVGGEVETCYGRRSFCGWLELLGYLEDVLEHARADAGAEESAGRDGR